MQRNSPNASPPPNPANRNLVTKATREGTTSLFISSYFSAWSATNQLATSLIRSRRWNYNAQSVGVLATRQWCMRQAWHISISRWNPRPHSRSDKPPFPSLSLSLFAHSIGIRPLPLFLSLSTQCIPLSNASLCPRYRLWHGGGRLHIEYRLSSAWNFNANQLWCLIEWRGPWTDSRGHSKTWRGGIRESVKYCVS